MNEFKKLKNLYNMYLNTRDKEERQQIKEWITEILEFIHQDCFISDVDINRNNCKITYTILQKYTNKETEGYYSFQTRKYYFNGLQFTA